MKNYHSSLSVAYCYLVVAKIQNQMNLKLNLKSLNFG